MPRAKSKLPQVFPPINTATDYAWQGLLSVGDGKSKIGNKIKWPEMDKGTKLAASQFCYFVPNPLHTMSKCTLPTPSSFMQISSRSLFCRHILPKSRQIEPFTVDVCIQPSS